VHPARSHRFFRSPGNVFTLSLLLLSALAASCGGADAQPAQALGEEEDALSGTRVRVVEANTTSGNLQAYEGPGIRIFQGLHPDIALVQEFNVGGNTQAEIDGFVQAAFGAGFSYYRESGAQIPNGIVTRFPILQSGSWTDPRVGNRAFAWAKIRVPDGRSLWAFSLHLLTSSADNRSAEATSLVAQIKATVPAGDYVVIGGDFNTGNRTEACVNTFSQVTVTGGPFPVDNAGRDGTSGNRSKPHDWVLVDPKLDAQETPVLLGSSSFPNGLVLDTRVYSPIAEIAPAQSGDSGASNMQHMAVVRDFLLAGGSTPPPAASIRVTSPNGGESWVASSTHPLTWTAAGVSTVNVEWSADGATWTTLAANVPAAAGSYGWTVPAVATRSGLVRVSDSTGPTADASDAPFAITIVTPPPPPAADAFEPDDTPAQAHDLAFNVGQVHDLSSSADVDWVRITLPNQTNVQLETSGPAGGDTMLRLYDETGKRQLASDDNSGAGNYSRLKRGKLPAGTYLAQVSLKKGAPVKGYAIRVTSY
jgi:endonuclease/exonuclease/phosphatase family metal-dependent hydrolase